MTIHVIGAGMAGLSAAYACCQAGHAVRIYDAALTPGGRCRRFQLGADGHWLDCGTHLILGANVQTLAFAAAIQGLSALAPLPAYFPILRQGQRQAERLSRSLPALMTPGIWKALGPGSGKTVTDRLGRTCNFHDLWAPLCISLMNTPPDQADAKTFARCLRAIFFSPKGTRPYLPQTTLYDALVEPALTAIKAMGGVFVPQRTLQAMTADRLIFKTDTIMLNGTDRVIVALPPGPARRIFPDLPALAEQSILNLHFDMKNPPSLPGGQPFLVLAGYAGQFLRRHACGLSLTISAANHWRDQPKEWLIRHLWNELGQILSLSKHPLPPHQLIWERRATLLHTPRQMGLRPRSQLGHWVLAGDWIDGPWPATIEQAITSGLKAARLVTSNARLKFR